MKDLTNQRDDGEKTDDCRHENKRSHVGYTLRNIKNIKNWKRKLISSKQGTKQTEQKIKVKLKEGFFEQQTTQIYKQPKIAQKKTQCRNYEIL